MSNSFQSSSYKLSIPDDLTRPFDITCPSSTDLWRSPPSSDRANAPFIYRISQLSDFRSARVTVSSKWTHLYDQGGLCIIVDLPDGQKNRWVKAGVELMDGKPRISVVGTDIWSDWSLHPIVSADGASATIEFVVKDEGKLWVYLHGDDGERYPLREITWWRALPSNAVCRVGVSAARPSAEGDDLIVHYKDLDINV